MDGKPRKRARGHVDYLLRVAVNAESQPVAVALIEAKAEALPPDHGLEQAKAYASCKRLNVLFLFSTNGRLFVEFDRQTGLTSEPRPLSEFPTPDDMRRRYDQAKGFQLEAPAAKPLLVRYTGERLSIAEARERYGAPDLEYKPLLPERVDAMCRKLFRSKWAKRAMMAGSSSASAR